MLDMASYTFVPVVESEDGMPYGMWVFEGRVPEEDTIQDVVQECMDAGYEWTLDDVTGKLAELGYDIAFIHPEDPVYI